MPAEFWADCERQVSLGASWGRDAKLDAPWCRDVGGIDDEVGWMVARGRRCPMLELRLELQRASSCLPAWSSSQASKAVRVVRRLTDARQSQNIPARLFPRTTHIRFRSATLLSAEQSPETGSSHLLLHNHVHRIQAHPSGHHRRRHRHRHHGALPAEGRESGTLSAC